MTGVRILGGEPHFSKWCYREFSLAWPAAKLVYWNKRKCLHKNRVQFPEDWFGIPIWPAFFILEHQYGRHDVICERSISCFYTLLVQCFFNITDLNTHPMWKYAAYSLSMNIPCGQFHVLRFFSQIDPLPSEYVYLHDTFIFLDKHRNEKS